MDTETGRCLGEPLFVPHKTYIIAWSEVGYWQRALSLVEVDEHHSDAPILVASVAAIGELLHIRNR
jgi:hypothetical protein